MLSDLPEPQPSVAAIELAALRNLPVPVVIASTEAQIVTANRAAEKLFKWWKSPSISSSSRISSLSGVALDQLGIDLGTVNWKDLFQIRQLPRESQAASLSSVTNLSSIANPLRFACNRVDDHVELDEEAFGETDDDRQDFRISISSQKRGNPEESDLNPMSGPQPSILRALLTVSSLRLKDGTYLMLMFSEVMPYCSDEPTNDTVLIDLDIGEAARNEALSNASAAIARMKMAIFNSTSAWSCIMTADEKYFLANKHVMDWMGGNLFERMSYDGDRVASEFHIWDEHFTRRLEPYEIPIIRVVRERERYCKQRIGLFNPVSGARKTLEVRGYCLNDDKTGEFIGGIAYGTEAEDYEVWLDRQRNQVDHRTICNTLPHLVTTTNQAGEAEFHSTRWYEYTGLPNGEPLGHRYTEAFHPDEVDAYMSKWLDCLATGTPFLDEARLRRYDGVYRWFLMRAVPQIEDGRVVRWSVCGEVMNVTVH